MYRLLHTQNSNNSIHRIVRSRHDILRSGIFCALECRRVKKIIHSHAFNVRTYRIYFIHTSSNPIIMHMFTEYIILLECDKHLILNTLAIASKSQHFTIINTNHPTTHTHTCHVNTFGFGAKAIKMPWHARRFSKARQNTKKKSCENCVNAKRHI